MRRGNASVGPTTRGGGVRLAVSLAAAASSRRETMTCGGFDQRCRRACSTRGTVSGNLGQSNLGQPRATSGNLRQSRAISPRLLDEGHRLADEVAHLEALAVGGQEDEDHVEVLHRRRQPEQPHRVGEAEVGLLEP